MIHSFYPPFHTLILSLSPYLLFLFQIFVINGFFVPFAKSFIMANEKKVEKKEKKKPEKNLKEKRAEKKAKKESKNRA